MNDDSFQPGVYSKGEYSFEGLLDIVRQGGYVPECGAIASFIGIVRNVNSGTDEDVMLEKLLVESNRDIADSAIQAICDDLTQGDVKRVLICHLEGEFAVGEDLVYVIVAGGHRHAVFAALQKAVERYKASAAIWKKEILSDGTSHWTH